MSDTPESLRIELEQQQRINAKLLKLLRSVQGALPDPDSRIGPIIDEAMRAKSLLDEAEKALRERHDSK